MRNLECGDSRRTPKFHLALPLQNVVHQSAFLESPRADNKRERHMHGRVWFLMGLLLLLALGGCAEEGAQPEAILPAPPAQDGPAFDAANTGVIEGQVVWEGPVPKPAPFVVFATPDNPPPDGKLLTYQANPFRPLVGPVHRGVEDVVVYLRRIDPGLDRRWPHDPVHIEQRERKLLVVQGSQTSRVGFVRRGDSIAAVNCDGEFHALRARGAAFFTLPFVDRDRPTARRLEQAGIVELSSGAGYFWMQAHLFVVEHPYYTRTDREGRFRLEQVPAGNYEAVCWMPSWIVARKERDPESGLIARAVFAPPVEQVAPVLVQPGAMSSVRFAWTEGQIEGAVRRKN
jgi:hypothetical protein